MSTEDITITTDRLVLRPLRRSDAGALAVLSTDDVFEMMPDIDTPFDAVAWVERKLESEVPPICHVVTLLHGEAPVGFVQVQFAVGKTDYYLTAGYWFGRDHWHKGYATEALTAVLHHIWGKGRMRPLYAQLDAHNAASRRVLEKCGFVQEYSPPAMEPSQDMLWFRWNQWAFRARLILRPA